MKKGVLLAAFLVSVIIVSGCAQSPGPGTSSGDNNQETDTQVTDNAADTNYSGMDCSIIEGAIERETCQTQQTEENNLQYLIEADRTMNYMLCGSITSSLQRQSCYIRVAEGTLNISLCQIPYLYGDLGTSCYDYIIERSSPTVCNVLTNQLSKSDCQTRAARQNS